MPQRHRYNEKIELVKQGTGTEYIEGKAIEYGKLLMLESISVEDETSALDHIRIGMMTPAYFLPWEEQKSPAAGELVFTQEEHSLREMQYFRCEVKGGAAGDKIKVYLDGYWQPWKE